MTSPVPTLRHCPKSCRRAWGETLYKAMKAITANPDNEAKWILLFALPKLLLRLPPRNNKKSRNNAFRAGEWLSSILTRARRGDWENLFKEAESSARPIKTTQAPRNTTQEATPLARDIKRKVLQLAQEGQFAKAVKNLTSAGLRNLDHDTLEELRSKHPQEPPQVPTLGNAGEPNGSSKTLPATPPPVFDYADVLKDIRSFPKGTAAGASGFRAQHLVDAYADPSKQDRESVLVPMAEVCTLLAAGKAPANAAPWIASAPIFPLKKKQGGIRPIAVGEVFRRLVSKLVLSSEGMQERIDKCL